MTTSALLFFEDKAGTITLCNMSSTAYYKKHNLNFAAVGWLIYDARFGRFPFLPALHQILKTESIEEPFDNLLRHMKYYAMGLTVLSALYMPSTSSFNGICASAICATLRDGVWMPMLGRSIGLLATGSADGRIEARQSVTEMAVYLWGNQVKRLAGTTAKFRWSESAVAEVCTARTADAS
jgi:hypothetical protein